MKIVLNSNECTYISGFMTWDAIAATSTPEHIELNKGLIFIRDADVLLSGDQWTIVVNIALDDYTNLVNY